MQVKEVVSALEHFAPLPLQDGFDNAGMQIGLAGTTDVAGALLCLDVTEEVIDEAVAKGCNLIVSHHPLLFHGVKQVVGATYVERCLMKALKSGIAIYSAHTNLDNARGGVNYKIAEKLGLKVVGFLEEKAGQDAGSGVICEAASAVEDIDFLRRVKRTFGVKCLMHNALSGRPIRRVALCGGAGAFLLEQAIAAGADLFLTGEMKYHEFFGHDGEIVIASIGHYESEQYTTEILYSIISGACPGLKVVVTEQVTNPINYL